MARRRGRNANTLAGLFLAGMMAVALLAAPADAAKDISIGRYKAYDEDMAICDQGKEACQKSKCGPYTDTDGNAATWCEENLDDLKGEVPVGFIALGQGAKVKPEQIEKELVQKVREEIGPIACFKQVMIVDKLPKTRSGKILRNVLKGMVQGADYKVPPTIEDESVLPKIMEVVKAKGLGIKTKL